MGYSVITCNVLSYCIEFSHFIRFNQQLKADGFIYEEGSHKEFGPSIMSLRED